MTGAASGIGKAAALRMVAEGVSVLAVDRDTRPQGAADAGCETMTADLADLGDRDAVERGADADFLVNAAGIISSSRSPR